MDPPPPLPDGGAADEDEGVPPPPPAPPPSPDQQQSDPPKASSLQSPRDAATQTQEAQEPVLENIPARFRAAANRVLERLTTIGRISWSSSDGRDLTFDGRLLGISLTQLLRAICVPFTRTTHLDPALRQLLVDSGLPFRNHLFAEGAEERGQWHPYLRF